MRLKNLALAMFTAATVLSAAVLPAVAEGYDQYGNWHFDNGTTALPPSNGGGYNGGGYNGGGYQGGNRGNGGNWQGGGNRWHGSGNGGGRGNGGGWMRHRRSDIQYDNPNAYLAAFEAGNIIGNRLGNAIINGN